MESHCQKQALCQQGNGRELLLDISMSPIITPRHINVGGGGGGVLQNGVLVATTPM